MDSENKYANETSHDLNQVMESRGAPLIERGVPNMVGSLSSVTKLNKKNFHEWFEDIEIELKLRGLEQAMTVENVDEVTDLLARRILLETMDSEHRALVRGSRSAKSIIDRVKLSYAEATGSNKFRLLQKFFRGLKDPADSIDVHIGKLDGMRSDMESVGIKIDEDVYLATIIGSLPPEFGNITELFSLADPAQRTKHNLISNLLNRELASKEGNGQQAFLTKLNRPKQKLTPEELEALKKRTRCGNCRQLGHWWRECPEKKRGDLANKQDGDKQPHKLNICLNLGDLPSEASNLWVVDTGATGHMCNNALWFSQLELYDNPLGASVGDGRSIPILGKGTIKFSCQINGVEIEGEMKNVNFIPSLATNLFSVQSVKAQMKGTMTTSDDYSWKLYNPDGVQILHANLKDSLFVLDIEVKKREQALIVKSKRSNLEWHQALGHPSRERMKTLLKSLDMENPDDEFVCADCPAGKAKHVVHPTRNTEKAQDVGERVHLDLVHIDNNKDNEYCYYLLSKDESSEFCIIQFLNNKMETTEAVDRLFIIFESGSGRPIRTILSDQGTEFKNRGMAMLCLKNGVNQEFSTPNAPQSNGFIERTVQTIDTSARTMLVASNLPNQLFTEALSSAVYLNNRLPTKKSIKTPYERFIGRAPVISNLVNFGQEAHVMIQGKHLRKYEARTRPCFVVGYTPRQNSYRVYIPSSRKVLESCDIYLAPHKSSIFEHDNGESDSLEADRVQIDTGRGQLYATSGTRLNPKNHQLSSVDSSAPEIDGDAHEYERVEPSAPDYKYYEREMGDQKQVGKNGKTYIEEEQLDKFFHDIRRAELRNDSSRDSVAHDTESQETMDISEPSVGGYKAVQSDKDQAIADTNSTCTLANTSSSSTPTIARQLKQTFQRLFLSAMQEGEDPMVPRTFEQAVYGPNKDSWLAAIESEFEAHELNGTWKVVDRPGSGTTLTTKWVFAIKRDSNNNIERYKARLVARGYEQREGVDFVETFAPVATTNSIRLLLAISVVKQLAFQAFDVTTAFLNGELKETIYIEAPKGLQVPANKCLRLQRALYGLKQAPCAWNSKFKTTMADLCLWPLKSDPCVYTNTGKSMFVVVYVDDGLIIGNTKRECENLLEKMNRVFKTKAVSGSIFLGLEINRNANGLTITQRRYIDDMLKRFKLENCRPVSTPMADLKNVIGKTKDAGAETDAPYRSAVGSLLYLALNTRPDILYPTIFLSTFNHKPREQHWEAAKRLMRYVKGTRELALVYRHGGDTNVNIEAFSDADWAKDRESGRSISGIVVTINKNLIMYNSMRQQAVALSTCEAEFVAASEASRSLAWLINMLDELGIEYRQPKLYIDCKPALGAIKTQKYSPGLKHIDLRYKYICQQVSENRVSLEYIETTDQPADLLTKGVSAAQTTHLLKIINIKEDHESQEPAGSCSSSISGRASPRRG